MHTTTRLLALLLAVTMLLPLAACGTNTEDPQSPEGATTESATEGETDFFPDIAKTDYKGATFHMIGFNQPGTWYYAEDMSNEQGSVHVLNNTIYEMNTLVEDHLGIEITYEKVTNVVTGGEVLP